jgi:hypothetical protein
VHSFALSSDLLLVNKKEISNAEEQANFVPIWQKNKMEITYDASKKKKKYFI